MQVIVFSLLIGVLGGIAIGFQNPLASMMGTRIGLFQGAFIIHLSGALVAGLLVFIAPGGQLAAWRSVPWYALWAGALGVIVVVAVTFTIPRVGVAATVGIVMTAQLIVAAWLDHNGFLGSAIHTFDGMRALGMTLLVAGTWLVLK